MIEADKIIAESLKQTNRFGQTHEMVKKHSLGIPTARAREPRLKDVELLECSAESGEQQIENVRALKPERDSREVARTLSELEQATKAGKNVMPYLVDCCKAYAIVVEMAKVLRHMYEEFQEPSSL